MHILFLLKHFGTSYFQDANKCDDDIHELRQNQQELNQQLEERQLNVQQLQSSADTIDGDIERLIEYKHKVLCAFVTLYHGCALDFICLFLGHLVFHCMLLASMKNTLALGYVSLILGRTIVVLNPVDWVVYLSIWACGATGRPGLVCQKIQKLLTKGSFYAEMAPQNNY